MSKNKLTLKQKRFADEYIIRQRINASLELSKRYMNVNEIITDTLIDECILVLKNEKTDAMQKLAAKTILKIKYGVKASNDMIEPFAIVSDRNDALVLRWKKNIINRDLICQICGAEKKLEVHHISHWADDPINRINPENGILLCATCHSNQHPELSFNLFGGKKHER